MCSSMVSSNLANLTFFDERDGLLQRVGARLDLTRRSSILFTDFLTHVVTGPNGRSNKLLLPPPKVIRT
jgi:hypothetical protein